MQMLAVLPLVRLVVLPEQRLLAQRAFQFSQ
jgi:hypothetical protein